MSKPANEDRDRFHRLVPKDPRVTTKPMFGNLEAFVNGHLFTGLFGSAVGLKLPEDARRELLANGGAGSFGPSDRPMRDYVALPPAWDHDSAGASVWVHRAFDHVAAMPPRTATTSSGTVPSTKT